MSQAISPVSHFSYVALAVKDIKKTARFFAETFGGNIQWLPGLESEGYLDAFVEIGNFKLYLMQPVSEDSVIARFIQKHGEGIHHICFKYDDYDLAVERLKQRNLTILERKGKYSFVHPKDAFGVLIELAPTNNGYD